MTAKARTHERPPAREEHKNYQGKWLGQHIIRERNFGINATRQLHCLIAHNEMHTRGAVCNRFKPRGGHWHLPPGIAAPTPRISTSRRSTGVRPPRRHAFPLEHQSPPRVDGACAKQRSCEPCRSHAWWVSWCQCVRLSTSANERDGMRRRAHKHAHACREGERALHRQRAPVALLDSPTAPA